MQKFHGYIYYSFFFFTLLTEMCAIKGHLKQMFSQKINLDFSSTYIHQT